MQYKGLTLDRFQEEAIEAVDRNITALIAAPTGCGKTIIAEYAIEKALAEGRQIIYTSPIKALSNQKFRDFSEAYPNKIGIMTGDVTLNPGAPVLIMTTEIFRNSIFENAERFANACYVIFDEVHYISDPERGTVWEESIIFAPPGNRFLALSATVPNVRQIAEWIRRIRNEEVKVIFERERPVPLEHHVFLEERGIVGMDELAHYSKLSRNKKKAMAARNVTPPSVIKTIIEKRQLPLLYFCFSRNDCERLARSYCSVDIVTDAERDEILKFYDGLIERYQIDDEQTVAKMRAIVGRGVAYHHAGMLPTMKEVIERLFTSGLIRLIFTTETFALGINMPARSVAFDTLRKYDGVTVAYMTTRDYMQMAGRAGRRGIDKKGDVYSRVSVRHADLREIKRLFSGGQEPVLSQFNLSYSTCLNLYGRLGDKIFEACEKSLMEFQHQWQKRRTPGKGGHARKEKESFLKKMVGRRLDVLERLGYLVDGEIRPRGRFAALINGYELQVTELYFAGIFEDATEHEINAILVACVYESRRQHEHVKLPKQLLRDYRNRALKVVDNIVACERKAGIRNTVKPLDFSLSHVATIWSRGGTWEELRELTTASDGDLVRNFRLMIQVARTLRALVKDDRIMYDKLGKALDAVNRGVVDAERQLRLGIEVDEAVEESGRTN